MRTIFLCVLFSMLNLILGGLTSAAEIPANATVVQIENQNQGFYTLVWREVVRLGSKKPNGATEKLVEKYPDIVDARAHYNESLGKGDQLAIIIDLKKNDLTFGRIDFVKYVPKGYSNPTVLKDSVAPAKKEGSQPAPKTIAPQTSVMQLQVGTPTSQPLPPQTLSEESSVPAPIAEAPAPTTNIEAPAPSVVNKITLNGRTLTTTELRAKTVEFLKARKVDADALLFSTFHPFFEQPWLLSLSNEQGKKLLTFVDDNKEAIGSDYYLFGELTSELYDIREASKKIAAKQATSSTPLVKEITINGMRFTTTELEMKAGLLAVARSLQSDISLLSLLDQEEKLWIMSLTEAQGKELLQFVDDNKDAIGGNYLMYDHLGAEVRDIHAKEAAAAKAKKEAEAKAEAERKNAEARAAAEKAAAKAKAAEEAAKAAAAKAKKEAEAKAEADRKAALHTAWAWVKIPLYVILGLTLLYFVAIRPIKTYLSNRRSKDPAQSQGKDLARVRQLRWEELRSTMLINPRVQNGTDADLEEIETALREKAPLPAKFALPVAEEKAPAARAQTVAPNAESSKNVMPMRSIAINSFVRGDILPESFETMSEQELVLLAHRALERHSKMVAGDTGQGIHQNVRRILGKHLAAYPAIEVSLRAESGEMDAFLDLMGFQTMQQASPAPTAPTLEESPEPAAQSTNNGSAAPAKNGEKPPKPLYGREKRLAERAAQEAARTASIT